MFSKILIANRGESAVRIIRTCRALGISPVAIHSSVDSSSLHVQLADEAYEIGDAPASQSYLRGGVVVDAARRANAEAVHPGYGFLAENSEFARDVIAARLVWIGPPPAAMELLGNKVASKHLAERLGIPTVPGYSGEDQTDDTLETQAVRLGYPILIKATAGGGGKGMRAVHSAQEFREALDGARREAISSFADGRVFLEKLFHEPRHVEIQIIADAHGTCFDIGERDCSIQRRHQKIVEEAPSPSLSDQLGRQMRLDAVRLAQQCGYVGAGTVEFLVNEGRYYFLEVNTRLQVEHPVTEMVTGIDLVHLQLKVASGLPLDPALSDPQRHGHAIEARVYAEDPYSGFLPSTGTLTRFRVPQGPEIRNDVGVSEGEFVSSYYDPMLAKLIVHGNTREEAVGRLERAVRNYEIAGVKTNLPFLQWIARQNVFRAGVADTGFLDRHWNAESMTAIPPQILIAAAAFEVMENRDDIGVEGRGLDRFSPWRLRSGWRPSGTHRTFCYTYAGMERVVETVRSIDGQWEFEIDGQRRSFHAQPSGASGVVLRHGVEVWRYDVERNVDSMTVIDSVGSYRLQTGWTEVDDTQGGTTEATAGLSAPMPGTVVSVTVAVGDRVVVNQPLVVLEAMKMEHVIRAPRDGMVEGVFVTVGELIPAGLLLVRLVT